MTNDLAAAPTRLVFPFAMPRTIAVAASILVTVNILTKPLVRLTHAEGTFGHLVTLMCGLATALVLPIWVLASLKIRARRKKVQLDRNRFACALPAYLQRSDRKDISFSLYLRPFFSDSRTKITSSETTSAFWSSGRTLTFEHALADALDLFAPMVMLGGIGNGPGRVEVDDSNWQHIFLVLAKSASLILVVPFAQRATEWEIDQLRKHNLLGKCIFVVPPPTRLKRSNFSLRPEIGNSIEILSESRKHFARLGFFIPELPRKGGFFMLDSEGRVARIQRMGFADEFTPDEIREKLRAFGQDVARKALTPTN